MKIASMNLLSNTQVFLRRIWQKVLRFWDFDDQAYQLISDELNQGVAAGTLEKRTCSTEFAIYGLGPVEIAISYFHEFKEVFEEILGFHVVAQEGNRYLLEVGQR